MRWIERHRLLKEGKVVMSPEEVESWAVMIEDYARVHSEWFVVEKSSEGRE